MELTRRALEDQAHLIYRLAKRILQMSPTTVVTGMLVALVLLFTLYNSVDNQSLMLWFGVVTTISALRLWFLQRWKKSLTPANALQLLKYYRNLAFLAGVSWSGLVLLYKAQQDPVIQTFILIVLIGMPMAALSSNAICLRIFYAFIIPILAAVLFWLLFIVPEFYVGFLLAYVMYGALIVITGRQYHSNLRVSVQRELENEKLVEELRVGNAMLKEMAYIDQLTDLPNRRQFQESVTQALQRMEESNSSLALMLIDIDEFKQVNDTYGHEAGDKLLIEIARRIKESIRKTDVMARNDLEAARLGGDEFIVLLKSGNPNINVDVVASRILANLTTPMEFNGIAYTPSVSIGISIAPGHGEQAETLMLFADTAMYHVKKKGGNGYHVYNREIKKSSRYSLTLH